MANAIMGALTGSATGGMTGSNIGHMVVAKVLRTYRCADCSYTFSN